MKIAAQFAGGGDVVHADQFLGLADNPLQRVDVNLLPVQSCRAVDSFFQQQPRDVGLRDIFMFRLRDAYPAIWDAFGKSRRIE